MTSSKNSPSSGSTPPQPPTSSNGIYIGIAAVLLIGIAGLFVFKGKTEQPVAPPEAPKAVPAPSQDESRLDDVPPPPPEEDAGPEPAHSVKAPTPAGPNPDCGRAVRCKGEATSDLESALAVRARQARRCYETALKDDNSLKGKISLKVRIAGNGSVCSTAVTQDEIPAISGCVERVFRTVGNLPKPAGGCAEITVPMSFVPGH